MGGRSDPDSGQGRPFAMLTGWSMAAYTVAASRLSRVFAGVLFLCSAPLHAETPVCELRIASAYPHDPQAYTQGLTFHRDALIESTGLYGASDIRRLDLQTGKPLLRRALPDKLFGEGLVGLDERLYQLTWRAGVVRVYRWPGLQSLADRYIEGEGWGMSRDGQILMVSNGSSQLAFYDPRQTSRRWKPRRIVEVTDEGRPVRELNELEFIEGRVWANVWHQDRIALIDTDTGRVQVWLDLRRLRARLPESARSANGIAYDPRGKRIYLTGKYWPLMFEIQRPAGGWAACYREAG